MKKKKNSSKILYRVIVAALFSSMAIAVIASLSGGYENLVHETAVPRTVRARLNGSLHVPLRKLYCSRTDTNDNIAAKEGAVSLRNVTVYQYDTNGNTIHWYQYDKNGWLSDYSNSYYDLYGTVICNQEYDMLTGEEEETLYDNHYDEKGRITEQTVYQDGKVSLFKTFQYRDGVVITASSGKDSQDRMVMISTEEQKKLCEYVYDKDGRKKTYLYRCYDGRGRDLLQVTGYGPTDDHPQKALYTEWDDSSYASTETLYIPGDSRASAAYQQNRYTNDWQQTDGVRFDCSGEDPCVTDAYQAVFLEDEETGDIQRSHEMKFDGHKLEYFHVYQYRNTEHGRALTTKFSYKVTSGAAERTLEHYEYNESGDVVTNFKYIVNGDFTLNGTSGSRKLRFYDSGKLRSFLMEEDSEGMAEKYEFREDGTAIFS